MSKIEPEASKQGIDWQRPERKWAGEGDNGGKKGKGLVNEHVWMTHGRGQQGGDRLWESGLGGAMESNGGKIGTAGIEQYNI